MYGTVEDIRKRIMRVLPLLVAMGVFFLYNWIGEAVATAHVMPKVEKRDIGGIISYLQASSGMRVESSRIHLAQAKSIEIAIEQVVEGGAEEVNVNVSVSLLAAQTGIAEPVIRQMLVEGRMHELLEIQEIYFAPVVIDSIKTTPLTVSEWLAEEPIPGYEGMPMVDVRDGDILITKNSRFLGWRNGHAGLVVDAEQGLVLEAIMLGSPSQLCKISKWESYPSFLVLRLKADVEEGSNFAWEARLKEGVHENVEGGDISAEVAAYAKEHLVGVPYQLLAGAFSRRLYCTAQDEAELFEDATVSVQEADSNVSEIVTEALTGTQCAHLVWYAYKQFGIDLDSDGGLLVTPYDVQNSPYLEVVQSYGY